MKETNVKVFIFLFKASMSLTLSVLIIWLVGALFLTSPFLNEYSEDLGEAVFKDGFVMQHRSEGWADTTYSKLGLTEYDFNIAKSHLPKVAIFGNSYVEAHHIDCNYRMQKHLNTLLEDKALAVGIGRAAFSVANYYFIIPKYEKAINNIAVNVIFMGNIYDVMISKKYGEGELKYENGLIELKSNFNPPMASNFRLFVDRTKMFFLRSIDNLLDDVEIDLINLSAISEIMNSPNEHAQADIQDVWEQLFTKFNSVTANPIIFVYAPIVPRFENNRLIITDADSDIVLQFEDCCKRHNIGFINLGQAFVDNYYKTGRLARGFNNGTPGKGHLNEAGHRIAAEEIAKYLKEHPNVIYPN